MPGYLSKISIDSKICPTVYHYKKIDSTNNLARNIIEKENRIGFSIVATTQTEGKGQRGKLWESPQGGLWSSLAIQPNIRLSLLGMVPILSAVGIVKALESFGIKAMLKWPNDLLISHNLKKIGGILVEAKLTQFLLKYIIIGIGLNVNNTLDQYSIELQNQITTIFEEFNTKIDLDTLHQQIIIHIEKSFEILKSQGTEPLLNEWKKRDNILGMNLIVQNLEGEYFGKAVDISPNGFLILEMSNSERKMISNGSVTISNKND